MCFPNLIAVNPAQMQPCPTDSKQGKIFVRRFNVVLHSTKRRDFFCQGPPLQGLPWALGTGLGLGFGVENLNLSFVQGCQESLFPPKLTRFSCGFECAGTAEVFLYIFLHLNILYIFFISRTAHGEPTFPWGSVGPAIFSPAFVRVARPFNTISCPDTPPPMTGGLLLRNRKPGPAPAVPAGGLGWPAVPLPSAKATLAGFGSNQHTAGKCSGFWNLGVFMPRTWSPRKFSPESPNLS